MRLNPRLSGLLNIFLYSITPLIVGISSLGFIDKLYYSRLSSLVFLFVLILLLGVKDQLSFLKNLTFRYLGYLLGIGVIRIALSFLYFYALSEGPVVQNTLITFTWPIFLFSYSYIKSEKTNKSDLLCICLGIAGSFLIISKGMSLDDLMVFHHTYIVSLAYSLLGAWYFYNHKKIRNRLVLNFNDESIKSHVGLIFLQELVSFFLIFVISTYYLDESVSLGNEVYLMIILGIIGHALPQILLSFARSNLSVSEFSNQRFLAPVVCTSYLCFYYGDNILNSTFIGGALVIISLVLKRYRFIKIN